MKIVIETTIKEFPTIYCDVISCTKGGLIASFEAGYKFLVFEDIKSITIKKEENDQEKT